MMAPKNFLISLFFFLFYPLLVWAQDIPSIPEFSKDDRVLILAPHPDDETLGAGGVIQRARSAGARVRVVCYTNGDHNELAFIVYEKRLTFRTGEFLHMGSLRRKETIEAMASLGIPREDMIFMGYPDWGTLAILTQFWQAPKPYWSLLTRLSKVSYPDALSPGAPFVGESILKDLKSVIESFRPTKVFVSHPADTNRDHQSLYLFTRIALWDLEEKLIPPEIYPYIIHVIGWPKPRGHHLDLALKPPDKLAGVSWKQLILSDEEAKKKQTLVDFFKTEIECNPPYLYSYARKNELFGDFSIIDLKRSKGKDIVWHDVMLSGNQSTGNNSRVESKRDGLSGLSYAVQDKVFLIRLNLWRKLDKNLGIAIYLLGYKENVPFSVMPKINVGMGLWGTRIRNKGKLISVPGSETKFEGRSLIFSLPMAVLGGPDRVLCRVKTRTARFPLDASAWRILRIK
ncbi:MAG: PIG-L family deacetylase [Candidatus Omnitrophota bacterium]